MLPFRILTNLSGSSLLLRRILSGDLPAIEVLVNRAFNTEDLGKEVSTYLRELLRTNANARVADTNSNQSVISEYWVLIDPDSKHIIGLTGLYRLRWAWSRSYWLGWFALDPDLHGKGIGTKLLEITMATAKGYGAAHLKVETMFGGASEEFYKKNGFELEGKLKDHYGDNYDAAVLSRSLEDISPIAPED